MSRHTISLTINGEEISREVEARTLLVHFIRDHLSLTGTHIGCDTTSCGACTVLLDCFNECGATHDCILACKDIVPSGVPLMEDLAACAICGVCDSECTGTAITLLCP